jgi:hypothetical protein
MQGWGLAWARIRTRAPFFPAPPAALHKPEILCIIAVFGEYGLRGKLLEFHQNLLKIFIISAVAEEAVQRQYNAGVAQLVERNLAKVEVASSRLVSRSKYKKEASANTALPFFLQVLAQWQSGYAADCKSVYVGSIPACASSIFKARSDAGLFVFWRNAGKSWRPLFPAHSSGSWAFGAFTGRNAGGHGCVHGERPNSLECYSG